ncbi:mRNA-decapping enzyme-like protein [Musa troglodytarum]|uniref:mRNA-decapping enzyme-like protein n=2 Tax=Musa troglodytarum TaxID=320322 RepID=A0A9E7ETY5_9LILI|nr:mRNA-decapping enzyme-like protein [Musa troglodytarum]
MLQNRKVTPNLDQQSTKALNLIVLQRGDPFVEEILMTATHVTLYEFSIDLNQWVLPSAPSIPSPSFLDRSRKDVEGSLFVVKRNTQPRFQFIVMNRRNADNLVEDLLGDFEYEVQVPYLLYRNAAQEVNGIWFYDSHDCESVANLFSRILNAYSKVPPKPKVPLTKSEFEELEAVPSLSITEGPFEPPTSCAATPINDVPDDLSVFFSAAMNVGNATISGQFPLPSAAIPVSSQISSVIPTALPTIQSAPVPISATPVPISTTPLMLPIETNESSIGSSKLAANLVKPSFFSPMPSSSSLVMPPISSSVPTVPPIHPPVTMQRPYGTPLRQPFPPPTPPASLTPAPNYGPVITRDKIRDAFLRLVQNNDFIDMVYREMLNVHYP